VGGSVSSTLASDSIKMVCITAGASTEWVIIASVGAFTTV
jgi:4-hydroxy-3-methylbut-2-enyl diphosphate reductase IspH